MADNARSIASGFGREIIKSIAEASQGRTGAVRINEISTAKFKKSGGEADLRKRAASEISAELKKAWLGRQRDE